MDIKKILNIQSSNATNLPIDRTSNFILDYHIPRFLRCLLAVLVFFLNPYYKLLLILTAYQRKKDKKRFYFSVCAIFKDEELSLREWIEFHLLIGVDHFYLYNNNSTDRYSEILDPYIKSGVVSLFECKMTSAQLPVYMDCFEKYKNQTQWLAFIDLDEFICPFYDNDIKFWIKKYEFYPSVVMYWKMFGASGLIDHDVKRTIIEQYPICCDKHYDVGKTIFNTNFDMPVLCPKYIHEIPAKITLCGLTLLIPPINEFKKFIFFKVNRLGFHSGKDFTIQLNHYFSKSYGEYILNKRRRGTPTSTGDISKKMRSVKNFYWHQQLCLDSDYKIFRFLINLKVRLGYANHIENHLKNDN